MRLVANCIAYGICCAMAPAQLAPDNWLVSDTYTNLAYYGGSFSWYGGRYPASGAGPADSVVDEQGYLYVCYGGANKLAVDPITGVVTELWPFPTFGINGQTDQYSRTERGSMHCQATTFAACGRIPQPKGLWWISGHCLGGAPSATWRLAGMDERCSWRSERPRRAPTRTSMQWIFLLERPRRPS
jgi:hypothetical protein